MLKVVLPIVRWAGFNRFDFGAKSLVTLFELQRSLQPRGNP